MGHLRFDIIFKVWLNLGLPFHHTTHSGKITKQLTRQNKTKVRGEEATEQIRCKTENE